MPESFDWTALCEELIGGDRQSVLPPRIKLPMLPRALSEFTRKAQDPEADPGGLSRIIGTDAGLSGELLRRVNSASSGLRAKVTSVRQALAMMGIRAAQLHLTTSGLRHAMRSSSSKLIHFETFWNTNLERALLAREVAKLLGADTELAFTAAMLQDFLLPTITNQMLDDYLEFTEQRDRFAGLTSFERDKLGWDHAEAGAQVMRDWGLPDELICCVRLHHRGVSLLEDQRLGTTAAAAVAIASLLPDALRQEADGMERLIELERSWPPFSLLAIADKVDAEFRSLATGANNQFAFRRKCEKALKRATAATGDRPS